MAPIFHTSADPHSAPILLTRTLNALSRIATHILPRSPHSTRRLASTSIDTSSILVNKRQNTGVVVIPTYYQGLNQGPPPGTVAGIVLGAVAGFLLILWLLYTCANLSGGAPWGRRETVVEEEVIHRRKRSPRPSRSRSRSVSRSETIEVASAHRSPVRRETRRETIIEERRTSRPPEDDDIVEVIEEHSPPRRPSRKESRRTSGFRNVDPAEFGGGDRPIRKVSRR